MTKSSKTLFVILIAALLCLSLTLVACEPSVVYQVTFGSEAAQSVEKDGSITVPNYTVTDPQLQTCLGWSLQEGKTSASDVTVAVGATLTYQQLGELAVDGQVKFYPVVSTKKSIALTLKGATDKTATLVEGDNTSVAAPEVTVGAKQEFLGWATTQDATTAQISPDALINYEAVSALATNGTLTLFPVLKTYDLVVGIVNYNFELVTDEGEVIHDVNYYVGLVEEDFSALYPELEVLYRLYSYENGIEACGAQINADGDVDVILAGNTIDDPAKGNVTVIAKARLAAKYNPDNSRRGALVTNSKAALDMYALVIGSENKDVALTIGETTTTLNKAIGNKFDVSGITDPSGRVLIGFDRDATATTPEVVGTELDYDAVANLATEGAVTLYPIWGEFDLIVAVWGQNGNSNNYVTVEQIAQIETDFRAYLATQGITDSILRFDRVEGKTDEYAANIATDVLVILSGKNVESQTGATGKYECVNITVNSTRYAGVFTDRVTTEQQTFVDLFIKFVAEDTVEVTIGEAKTVVSLLDKNTVDLSAVEIPTGKKLVGFATTEGATTAEVAGTIINYTAVAELATEGKVTLYPVFEDDVKVDLVFDVLFKNITQDQIDTLIANFKAWLVANGDTTEYNIVVRTDFVGSGEDFLARVKSTGDVDVVLGASNLVSQTGNEIIVQEGDGAYGQLLAVEGSSRRVGMIVGCAHSELAIKFVQFCQTAPEA